MRLSLLLLLLVGVPSFAAHVEIYDRTASRVLPTYRHGGHIYVAGEPGHEYEVRIASSSSQRTLAVTTVDGVNVITGQTGALEQPGYVLEPFGYARIEGWRKSMSQTAAFYFTKLRNSYAARTGRPQNVGVIGVALFHERPRVPCCTMKEEFSEVAPQRSESLGAANAPASRDAAEAKSVEKRSREQLGTGHGRREYSRAEYTDFERAAAPGEIIVIHYDSRANLVAQGVIPSKPYLAHKPRPFPNSFVSDP